jgi:hypothetical protein
MTPSFNSIWLRIVACQGQQFRTVKGFPFTYEVKGQVLRVSRAKQNLPRSEFEKAYNLLPLKGPGEINNITRGPAYVYAILTDARIAGNAAQAEQEG